uniref:Major facilitator superfamily (MFS) profile domain-containing protein n=1 Tax=Acrobeloides nanus TaxID=290746 RepID=A0A914DCF8_9BILA
MFEFKIEWIRSKIRTNNIFSPRGKIIRIIVLYSIYSFVVNFQDAYSNAYPNTSINSFRNYINGSYISRGNHNGITVGAYVWLWSFYLNVNFIGFLVGTFATPYITDNYGRKVGSTISIVGTILMSISIWANSPELLIIGRFICSAATGISFGSLILFVQETTPTRLRGTASFLSETLYVFTNVVGMGFGLALIPTSIALVLTFFLKETPKFLLINKNKREEAEEAIEFYQGKCENHEEILGEIIKESECEKCYTSTRQGLIEVFKTPHLRKALFIGIIALQLMKAYWPLTYLSSNILMTHFSDTAAEYASFGFSFANFIACIAGNFVIDKFGRRPMLLINGVINTFCLILYIVFDRLTFYSNENFKYGCIVTIVVYGITYGLALGPIAYFITSELTPQQYRALVQSIALVIDCAVNFIFSFATMPVYDAIGVWAFIPLFIVPSILCLIYLFFVMPETKGREIHEILVDMKSGWRRRIGSCVHAKTLSATTSYRSCDEDSVVSTISFVTIHSVVHSETKVDDAMSLYSYHIRL